jgi:hypothetical protein
MKKGVDTDTCYRVHCVKTIEKGRTRMREQIVMDGVLTEADVVRAFLSKIGRKGGAAKTEAQTASRRRRMAAINRRKAARRALLDMIESGDAIVGATPESLQMRAELSSLLRDSRGRR